MAESTSEVAAPEEQEANVADQELTESGRYIPYSGGSMGWFENSGVLKCELGNNYLYYTEMASDRVRTKQFQRWGDRFNRRGSRQRFKKMIGVALPSGRNMVRGSTRDISRQGVRVQFLEEVKLQKGDHVPLRLFQDEHSNQVVFDGKARVAWSERVGRIRPVWNLGLTFEDMTPEQDEHIAALLTED